MTDRFMQQTATLKARTATDAYTGDTFTTSTIAVRWYTEETLLRMDDGREIVSSGHISTAAVISEGDRVTDEDGRDREILRVRLNRDSRGNMSHRVGYLR